MRTRKIGRPTPRPGAPTGQRLRVFSTTSSGISRPAITSHRQERSTKQTRRAFDLLGSSQARRAFRLEDEPQGNRDLYGETPFGQSVLLARRLVERGVRLVHVNWFRGPVEPPANPCWDSHTKESLRLKEVLVPPTDRAYAALLEDLDRRGLLDETLVVCMAEFGRTPRLDGYRAEPLGLGLLGRARRRRCPRRPGLYGASDRIGAYPVEGRVRPEHLSATIFHCLDHAPATEYRDPLGRSHPMSRGDVLHAILV